MLSNQRDTLLRCELTIIFEETVGESQLFKAEKTKKIM